MLFLLIPFFYKWPTPTFTVVGAFFGYSLMSRLVGVPIEKISDLDYDNPKDFKKGCFIFGGMFIAGFISYVYASQVFK